MQNNNPLVTNNDRMLRAVLANPKLKEFGKYEDDPDITLDGALRAENCMVKTVATIIDLNDRNEESDTIYRTVRQILEQNLSQ
jgi:hypothetical protein